jgi:hypothetical protein
VLIAIAVAVAVTISASTTRTVVGIRTTLAHDAQSLIHQFQNFIGSNTQ